MSHLARYAELKQDAENLVAFLEGSPRISDDVRYSGRLALMWYITTCTPAECVNDFEREIEAVKSLIELELGA